MSMTASDRVTITIDGRRAEVARGTTLLNAARQMGITIPTLCNFRGLPAYAACRVCLVELQTPRGPRYVASCSHPAEDRAVVQTDTEQVRQLRQTMLELMLAEAPASRELADFAAKLGVRSMPFEQQKGVRNHLCEAPLGPSQKKVPDTFSARNGECILCGLCVRVCDQLMGRGAINMVGRGAERKVAPAFGEQTNQCQVCGACEFVCPTGARGLDAITARRPKPHLTAHDQYLEARPNIDLAHPQASPRIPVIDRETCVHFKTGACGLCSQVCQAKAIDYDQQEETLELDVGSVVLTPGFEAFDATRRGEFGYTYAPNVVTNVQFERLLSASGPTQGHIRRPSDHKPPKRLALIQCVGSRDTGCDNEYCSSVCCMAATKEAILAKQHEPDLDVTIFFLDLRAFGKDFDRYSERAEKQWGVRYVRSFISRTYEIPGTRNLRLVYASPEMKQVEEEFDMVVLSLGMEPSASLREQAERMGVVLNRWGFAQTSELSPLDTSRPGVFVGGAFQEPKDIPDTVMQASAAAARAMALLAPARGSCVRVKTYPPERDISDEPPRVGVFVCHCGSNIASVVDVERVVRETRKLPYVIHAENNVYTCADDSQSRIKAKIAEHGLNRVVVASCTPRTHEPIFRDTLRDAGLNPFLLDMANIRDQCSWVHTDKPDRATEKAIDLVRMAVGRTAQLMPLQQELAPINNAALVIGGGMAGMTAALALAEQGFPVHLVEKSESLGGTARQLYRTLDGQDVQAFLAETIQRVTGHPKITVHLQSRAAKVEGHIGNFRSTLVGLPSPGADRRLVGRGAGGENVSSSHANGPHPNPLPKGEGTTTEIDHGAVIVATGATEAKPKTFGYGRSPSVLTQLELSERLGRGEISLPERATIVMIQCVEQRNQERPYCSRVCCTSAVKNALALRARYPQARIMVLYRDMRTYGFREAAYRQARERGVLFVRYEPEQPPELELDGRPEILPSPFGRGAGGEGVSSAHGNSPHPNPLPEGEGTARLRLRVRELSVKREMELDPDMLVLAAPMVPRADRQELSELLRVPLNADGFFLEAHMKLRPVDFASEGLFLCGTAHAPKFLSETIAQASAVAGRAASILGRKKMPVGGQIAWVDPDKCISCMTCVHVCPYMAPRITEDNKAEVQGATCMGCGSCTAECPAKAITLRHFVDGQILAAVNSLLDSECSECGVKTPELAYPAQAGVAPPRWQLSSPLPLGEGGEQGKPKWTPNR